MKIRAGFNLTYECLHPTPMLLALNIRPSRRPDLLGDDTIYFDPPTDACSYIDGFGNACTRIAAPAGAQNIKTEFLIRDSGQPDELVSDAVQHDIKDLPNETLVFLLGSRYCETDRMSDFAWATFSKTPPGLASRTSDLRLRPQSHRV